MEIIIKKRGWGKTATLIKKSAETGSYIVCHSQDEAARISGIAKRLNLKIPFPITHDEFLKGSYHARGISGFLIDNIELMLHGMTDVPINAITLTEE